MIWAKMGSLFMLLGVALGAFGAHGLKNSLGEDMMKIYQTAVSYHLIHALGLFVVAWLSTQSADSKINLAGTFMVAGILIFSGSLYVLSVTGLRWLGAITPLGGLAFITAWAMLFLAKFSD